MVKTGKRIIVAGDVTIDWLMYPATASDEGENWRLYNSMHSHALPGGALLLKDFLSKCCEAEGISANIIGHRT